MIKSSMERILRLYRNSCFLESIKCFPEVADFNFYKFKKIGVFLYRIQIILLLLVLPAFAFPQNESDSLYITDEIRVVSFRNESNILNSASNIHIINSKTLNSINGKNIGDVLSTVPGVFIKNYGNVSSLQTISLNGLGAEHTTVLLNGFKLNTLQNGQIDLSLIPKENVSRIEVLNNGYSSVYGSEAMSGVVNIITDDDLSSTQLNDFSLSLNALYGSYNNKKFLANTKKRFKNIKFDFLISNEKSDNDFDYYFNNGETKEKRKRENSDYQISNYSFTMVSDVTSNLRVNLYSQFVNSDKNVPGIETGNTSPLTKQTDKNWNTILGFNYKWNSFSLENGTNFQNNLMNYKTFPVLNSFYKNIVFSNSTKIGYNERNILSILGFEFMKGSLNSNQVEENVLRNQYSLYNSSTISFGRLLFYPSLRYDFISDIKKDVWTYKLGLNFKLLKNFDFHLKGNIGRNFRAPTFNELYWKEGGNKSIRPESSDNYEIGFIASGCKSIFYTFEISFIYLDADNRILWKPGRDRIWRPVNILESRSEIFNTSLKLNYKLKKEIVLMSELSYCHNSSVKKNENYAGDETVNKQMIYVPKEQAKIALGIEYKTFVVNLFYSYIGVRFSDTENLNPLSPASTLDGNIKYDFSISNFSIGLKLDVNNITNTDYQYVSGYPLPLRNFLFSINFKYHK